MKTNVLLVTARIAEPRQRLIKVLERLTELSADEAVAALAQTLAEVRLHNDAARLVLECLLELPYHEDRIGYARMSELYQVAHEQGLEEVLRLLRPGGVARRPVKDGAPDNATMDSPLGTRKMLARRTDRLTIDRMLRDKHPAVLRVLLDNPRLIERDVVAIVAQKPNHPDVFAEVMRHPRWIKRYDVQKALVFNPFFPFNRSVPLLEFLTTPDLKELVRTPQIAAALRELAQRCLQKRS